MTDLSPEGVVRSYFGALNARDFARAAGPIAEDCHWTSIATEKTHTGPAAIVAGLKEFVTAFPDWRVELERVTTQGDVVVVEWSTSGTFEKPFRGYAANGKRFVRRGCAIADVEGGRIVRYRDYYDRLTLLQQLGMEATPAGGSAVSLRAATSDDAGDITACVARAFQHYVSRIGKPPGPMTENYAEVIAQRDVTIAQLAGRLVGVLVLDSTEEGFLLDVIAVDPAAQGKGVGRALLERAEERAKQGGHDSIYLFTNEKMTENQELYAKIGYVEYDRRFDGGYFRVFMRKPLR